MTQADVSNSIPVPDVTPRGFQFERAICDLNNMARLVSLAADTLLSDPSSTHEPDTIRMALADRAMLLFGVGQLETMTANLRGKLV